MEIGLFQLENLCSGPANFLFFDLRENPAPSSPEIQVLFRRANAVKAKDLNAYLKEKKIPKETCLILMCENGKTSEQQASELENEGFTQVYRVAGGVLGLLSEL
jgi:rhodanese-related sulfurtransferase